VRGARYERWAGLLRAGIPLLGMALLAASCSSTPGPPLDGTWRAVLGSPGGDLPFSLEILLAGIGDKSEAAESLPDLTGIVAFPTTIFVGRDGKVRRVHSGYAGPATGEHHRRMIDELASLIETLLAETVSVEAPAR
jgi:hypothetical protein